MSAKKILAMTILAVSTVAAYASSDNLSPEHQTDRQETAAKEAGDSERQQGLQVFLKAAGFDVLGVSRPVGGSLEQTVFVIRPASGNVERAVYRDGDRKRHHDKGEEEHKDHS
jgi:hypothetical protein